MVNSDPNFKHLKLLNNTAINNELFMISGYFLKILEILIMQSGFNGPVHVYNYHLIAGFQVYF
jgi:hypothetical protein